MELGLSKLTLISLTQLGSVLKLNRKPKKSIGTNNFKLDCHIGG